MKKSKILALILCAALLITTTVLGTLAYLTSQDSVVNTFTVGQVEITLDEAKVNPDGTPVTPAARTSDGNQYHLIPGVTYTKDPTMTVKANSEEAYVRMLLTLNCKSQLDTIFAPGVALTTIFNGYDDTNWIFEAETTDTVKNTVTYEFRYKEAVKPTASDDLVLDALFDSFTIPGTLNGDDLKAIEALEITVVGHAVQTTGFGSDDDAWAAFDTQNNS